MSFALLVVAVSLIILKIIFKLSNNFCKSKKRLDGKTCLVTGGTRGMGLEIAREFAKRGARVIIACESYEEGVGAQKLIEEETGSKSVIFKFLDLASFKSTAKFADDILQTESKLHILVNNAGIGHMDKITEDDIQITTQVNYYGHFLLTLKLLPLLKKTGSPTEKSRIVLTTSCFHFGTDSFEPNLKANKLKIPFSYYATSKLSLLLFATELTKRLQGHNVVVNSVDPGGVGTAIFRNWFVGLFLRLFVKTPWEGAQTALHVSLADEIENISGHYFSNCKLAQAKSIVYDENMAKKLWDISAKVVNLKV